MTPAETYTAAAVRLREHAKGTSPQVAEPLAKLLDLAADGVDPQAPADDLPEVYAIILDLSRAILGRPQPAEPQPAPERCCDLPDRHYHCPHCWEVTGPYGHMEMGVIRCDPDQPVRYQVTFDRIGRHRVPPLAACAVDFRDLSEQILAYARPLLASTDVDVVIVGAHEGHIMCGAQAGGSFTITPVDGPETPT